MFSYTAIKEIEIPNTMTYVGTSAFANCASLEKLLSKRAVPKTW